VAPIGAGEVEHDGHFLLGGNFERGIVVLGPFANLRTLLLNLRLEGDKEDSASKDGREKFHSKRDSGMRAYYRESLMIRK
jgi:hypothetical protein